MSATAADTDRAGVRTSDAAAGDRPACCGLYHRAIELVGKRWTGAILLVLMDGPLHFSGIRQLVPELSDRLLSERLKELEGEGIVERRVLDGSPGGGRGVGGAGVPAAPRVGGDTAPPRRGGPRERALRALKQGAHETLPHA